VKEEILEKKEVPGSAKEAKAHSLVCLNPSKKGRIENKERLIKM
jgi:hypothetical protein